MNEFHIAQAGERALLIETTTLDAAMILYDSIERARRRGSGVFEAVRQVVPAARTVLIEYQPLSATATALSRAIRSLPVSSSKHHQSGVVTVPVVYDGDDLDFVAKRFGMSVPALIDWHTNEPWHAAFAGFAPGFVYLTGGRRTVNVPRRAKPRVTVPSGAVGLAGPFSGVYPRPSSGGWQLIGRTDTPMWDDRRDAPATIQPGDLVRFTAEREHVVSIADTSRSVTEIAETVKGRPVLRVDRPGLLAILEDDGRVAASLGVAESGSADRYSAHLANRLVGNPAAESVIELTGGLAEFTALDDVVVAVAGAPVSVIIHTQGQAYEKDPGQAQFDMSKTHGISASIHRQEPFLLRRGESVEIGEPSSGLRDYVAVRGGFSVKRVLGSASTDTMSQLGPRPLSAGDQLRSAEHRHCSVGHPLPWSVFPSRKRVTDLAIKLGPRDNWFTAQALANLLNTVWTVTPQSNRVGLRLQGANGLHRRIMDELPSEGTVPGALEVPSDGQPVLLLRDGPVTGGYPVIAVLTTRALGKAAQLAIGTRLRFVLAEGTNSCPLSEANQNSQDDQSLVEGEDNQR